MTPLWKRLQPEPKTKSVSQMMQEADRLTGIYSECGIVNGEMGSLKESDLRETMTTILNQPGLSGNERYDLLDALWFQGVNNMEFFRISDVEEEIRAAQNTVLNQK